MKLTEAKLKKLILEQMDELNSDSDFETGKALEFLKKLLDRLPKYPEPENTDIVLYQVDERNRMYNTYSNNKHNKLNDILEVAIDSLERESAGIGGYREWEELEIQRSINTGWVDSDDFGNWTILYFRMKRNGEKYFSLEQIFGGHRPRSTFTYYSGNEISTDALVELLTLSSFPMRRRLIDFLHTFGKETQDSATL